MTFPRNHWYVVARAGEIGRGSTARTICGEHVVMYRTSTGDVVAFDDPGIDAGIAEMNRAVVLQDVDALSLVEQRLGDEWAPPEVSFEIDAGGPAGRRVTEQLIAVEA